MGLIEEVKDVRSQVEILTNETKEKKFKYPFGKKVSKGQRKKNYVTVLLINENGTYEFKKYQISGQTIIHDSIPRLAAAGYTMFDGKGNPLIILPNWSLEPFSPLNHYQQSLIDGSNTKGFKLLLEAMTIGKIDNKPKMSGMLKWIIGLALVGIIAYAFISGGGN